MPRLAIDNARLLMSTASIWNRSGGTPASRKAMTKEYGSSPDEHGILSTRKGAVRFGTSHSSKTSRVNASKGSESRKNHVSVTRTVSTNSFHSIRDVLSSCSYSSSVDKP